MTDSTPFSVLHGSGAELFWRDLLLAILWLVESFYWMLTLYKVHVIQYVLWHILMIVLYVWRLMCVSYTRLVSLDDRNIHVSPSLSLPSSFTTRSIAAPPAHCRLSPTHASTRLTRPSDRQREMGFDEHLRG